MGARRGGRLDVTNKTPLLRSHLLKHPLENLRLENLEKREEKSKDFLRFTSSSIVSNCSEICCVMGYVNFVKLFCLQVEI